MRRPYGTAVPNRSGIVYAQERGRPMPPAFRGLRDHSCFLRRQRPKPAITDGRVITGRSAGHAVAFGLEILKKVKGEKVAAEVRHAMMLETI